MQLGSFRIKKMFSDITEVSLRVRISLLYPRLCPFSGYVLGSILK